MRASPHVLPLTKLDGYETRLAEWGEYTAYRAHMEEVARRMDTARARSTAACTAGS